MKQYIKTRWPMCHLVEFDVTHLLPELPAPWSDEDDVGEGPMPEGETGSLSQKKFRLSFFDFNSFEFVWQRIRSLCLIINSWKSWGNPASDVVARKALLNEVTLRHEIYLSCNYIAGMTLYTLKFLRITELELKRGQTMRPLVVIVTSPFACTIRSGFGIKKFVWFSLTAVWQTDCKKKMPSLRCPWPIPKLSDSRHRGAGAPQPPFILSEGEDVVSGVDVWRWGQLVPRLHSNRFEISNQ